MKFKSEVQLEALNNATVDTDKFLVSDSSTVKYRTGSEVLSDIGAISSVTATGPITSTGGATPVISTSMATNKLIGRSTAGTGVMEQITIGSGLALSGGTLSSSALSGSILHGIAAGTDTYTVTITGATAYADGDAYLINFTNGNTTSCTLNINGQGAVSLYRNNDGPLIGGDIVSGGEVLCVYRAATNVFQCIGTAPNTLLAYATNAETSTITKGQAVYVSGGVGDRIKVKLASNVTDATSAQTIGIVQSTSIAANQKGLIIVQGQLDNLSLFPTATWADGDFIYLGATAGTLTNVKPVAPNHLVYLGYVTTASNGSAGRMYVKVQNGYEMSEIHDVYINPATLANGDLLQYNSATDLWLNKSLSAAGIQPTIGYVPLSSANNGLSLSGTIAQLGGTLLQPTLIDGGAATAYNLTFTNGDLVITNGAGTGGLRGNIVLSNNRQIYWGASGSGSYIGADAVSGGFVYRTPITGKQTFYASMQFINYGSGTKTGTAAYNLAVTSAGDIIETAIPPVIPTFTSGSVIFSNGTTLAQDNANFFWDDTNNRLGIGTTNPSSKLHISSSGEISRLESSTTTMYQTFRANGTNVGYIGNGTGVISGGSATDFGIQIANNFVISTGGSSEKMRISSTGNVGIGTTGAVAKLEVLGTNSASPSRANASTYIIGADVGLAVGQYNSGLFGTWMQSLRSTDNLAFPLSINPSGGNVAIGKASPSTALDVNGVITATGGSSTSWNAKQDALVSGTNIRTVNNQTIVGPGNINIGGAHGLVPVPTASGLSYSQSIDGGGFSVIGGTANRMYLAPFMPVNAFNSISLSIQVTSAVAGAVIRLLLYSNSGGRPQGKLWESASLDCSTTGVKTAALTTSFTAGSTVWIGVQSSSTAGTYALSATQLIPLYNLNGSTTVSSYYLTAAIGSAPATITSGLTGHTGSIPMAVINV